MPRGRTAEPVEKVCKCGCGRRFLSRENAAKLHPQCKVGRRRDYLRQYRRQWQATARSLDLLRRQ